MSAQQLLHDLGQQAQMSQPLTFNEHGCARLQINGDLELNIENDTEAHVLQVYSVLGAVPVEEREAFFRMLLAGNLFGHQTAGATLALDPETGEIVLSQQVDAEHTTSPGFQALIEHFIVAATEWRARIVQFAAPVSGKTPASTAAVPAGHFTEMMMRV